MNRAYRTTERLVIGRVQYIVIAPNIATAVEIVHAGRSADAWPPCTIVRCDRRDAPLNFEFVP